MYCTNCGKIIADGSRYCVFCGAKIAANSAINTSYADLKEIILECIATFDGKYGKNSISYLLKGSKKLREIEYNMPAINSNYYGVLNTARREYIVELIDELIQEKKLIIEKKRPFGRQVLSINLK